MPEVTTLLGVQVGVVPGEGDQINLMIADPATGKQYILPMDPEGAKTIGQGLIAPRVAQPPQQIVLPR
jgi:hypothetical protein